MQVMDSFLVFEVLILYYATKINIIFCLNINLFFFILNLFFKNYFYNKF